MIFQPSHDSLAHDPQASPQREAGPDELSKSDVSTEYSDDFERRSGRDASDAEEDRKEGGHGGSDSISSGSEGRHVDERGLEREKRGRTNNNSDCVRNGDDVSPIASAEEDYCKRTSSSSLLGLSNASKQDGDTTSTMKKIDKAVKRLERKSPAGKNDNSLTSPGEKLEADATLTAYNDEAIPVPTKEELADLLAHNDELRTKLLENRRAMRHSTGRYKNASWDNTRVLMSRQQYRKTTMAIQRAMRREEVRQELREERQYLGALREDLRKSIATSKRLRSYLPLIEECKNEILHLVEEKRALLLGIRQNEKILLNNKADQESDIMIRRLREEIKADGVLTQRALQRAQREALEAVKMHQNTRLRVQKLEEELAQAENNVHPEDMDPELRRLYEVNQQRARTVQQLRKQLRRMKSRSPNEMRRADKEASKKDARKEREELVKSILEMRKKVRELSVKADKGKLQENLKVDASTTSDRTGPAALSRGTTASRSRRSGSIKPTPDVSAENNAFNQLNNEDEDDTERVMKTLKARVEQNRAVRGGAAAPDDDTFIGEVRRTSREGPTRPIFLSDEDDVSPGSGTGVTLELEAEKKLTEEDTSGVPPWFNDSGAKNPGLEFSNTSAKPDFRVADDKDERKDGDDVKSAVGETRDGGAGGVHLYMNTNAGGGLLSEAGVLGERVHSGGGSMAGEGDVDATVGVDEEGRDKIGVNVNVNVDASPSAPVAEPSWLDFD